jgi:hypothetical protein
VEAGERGEPAGLIYTGRSLEGADIPEHEPKFLRELLSARDWDVVGFHQASIPSSDVSSYRPYAAHLVNFIRELCPGADIVLHQTWALRCDAPCWGEIGDGIAASSQREMWEKSRAAYHAVAAELALPLIPTGDAFWQIDSDPQWAYRPDPNFNFAAPQFPELPDQSHSLHAGYYWSQDRQFSLDFKHTSNAGAYLGSLMWHAFLFGADPEQVSFVPPAVPTDFAAHLRAVAARTASTGIPAKRNSVPPLRPVRNHPSSALPPAHTP